MPFSRRYTNDIDVIAWPRLVRACVAARVIGFKVEMVYAKSNLLEQRQLMNGYRETLSGWWHTTPSSRGPRVLRAVLARPPAAGSSARRGVPRLVSAPVLRHHRRWELDGVGVRPLSSAGRNGGCRDGRARLACADGGRHCGPPAACRSRGPDDVWTLVAQHRHDRAQQLVLRHQNGSLVVRGHQCGGRPKVRLQRMDCVVSR